MKAKDLQVGNVFLYNKIKYRVIEKMISDIKTWNFTFNKWSRVPNSVTVKKISQL